MLKVYKCQVQLLLRMRGCEGDAGSKQHIPSSPIAIITWTKLHGSSEVIIKYTSYCTVQFSCKYKSSIKERFNILVNIVMSRLMPFSCQRAMYTHCTCGAGHTQTHTYVCPAPHDQEAGLLQHILMAKHCVHCASLKDIVAELLLVHVNCLLCFTLYYCYYISESIFIPCDYPERFICRRNEMVFN